MPDKSPLESIAVPAVWTCPKCNALNPVVLGLQRKVLCEKCGHTETLQGPKVGEK